MTTHLKPKKVSAGLYLRKQDQKVVRVIKKMCKVKRISFSAYMVMLMEADMGGLLEGRFPRLAAPEQTKQETNVEA